MLKYKVRLYILLLLYKLITFFKVILKRYLRFYVDLLNRWLARELGKTFFLEDFSYPEVIFEIDTCGNIKLLDASDCEIVVRDGKKYLKIEEQDIKELFNKVINLKF